MDLSGLEKALNLSWIAETSSDSDNWTAENPAWGQCAVTSLIVNDYFKGEIVWCQAILPDGRKISHYFNLIENREIDLTKNQFPENTIIPRGVPKTKDFATTRGYILSFPATQKRYELLKKNVEENLK